jgi:FkbM family methyltransferase
MHYALDNEGSRRNFREIRQNFYVYQSGIAKRAENLAKEYMLDLIEFVGNSPVVIDCGANIGDLKLSLVHLKVNPRYIAFEPSPDEFECLKANTPDAEIFNLGLWNSMGQIDFYISTPNADSSIIRPASFSKKIQVTACRLDQVQIDAPVIDLIKLEAEGAEFEVIQGAEGVLAKTRYIAADLGFERNGESPLAEVTNFLVERNFKIISFGHPRIIVLFKNSKLD